MPALVAGIHVFKRSRTKDVDGRNKSGHDATGSFPFYRGCAAALSCYIKRMTVEDLEKAVAKLPPDQLARFRAWFEAFDAARFDRKIERDIKAGKLDALGDRALDDFRKGRAREL